MIEWKPDERYRRTYAHGISMVPENPKGGGQSAHLIDLGKWGCLRVLPGDRHSGRARGALVLGVMPTLEALVTSSSISEAHVDPMVYLKGYLEGYRLEWEEVLGEVSIEEWLDEWFENTSEEWREDKAELLLHDLEADGWTPPQRKGEE